MLRRGFLGAAVAATALAHGLRPARALDAVDVLLVLAVDVSRSVDDSEARLQREGYCEALLDERVIETIEGGMLGAIGVAYVEWSGAEYQRLVMPWTHIASHADAEGFVSELQRHPPRSVGWTSISAAIDYSCRLIADAPWDGMRKVIDISGDGVNNSGRPVEQARDDAVEQGVIINGLPVLEDRPVPMAKPLDDYFRESVVGGPGAFVVAAEDFSSFAGAVRRKLIMEIAGPTRAHGIIAA